VSVLAGSEPSGNEASGRYFADRFGQLLGLSGAVSLSNLHEDLRDMAFTSRGVAVADVARALRDTFLRERGALVHAIAAGFVAAKGDGRGRLPTPAGLHAHFQLTGLYTARRPGSARIRASAFAPYGKFYAACQRQLETRARQLRSHVRAEISRLSLELAQLAKLDASFEKVLSARTRELFAVTPTLLEQRFGRRLDDHRRTLPKAPTAEDLAPWMQPGGWIWTFCGEMRELLLAELDVRLEPVLGMMDSLRKATAADCARQKEKDPGLD
jgi:hypothetical protein